MRKVEEFGFWTLMNEWKTLVVKSQARLKIMQQFPIMKSLPQVGHPPMKFQGRFLALHQLGEHV